MAIVAEMDPSELNAFLARLQRSLDRNVPLALRMAGRRIADRAKRILDEEGHVKTGALRNSIGVGEVDGSLSSGSLTLVVGTSQGAQGSAAGQPPPVVYAEFVEKGTAPHTIRAVESGDRPYAGPSAKQGTRATLRFVAGGGFVFRKEVSHPGTKAVRFMERAVSDEADAIGDVMSDAVADAIAEAEGR